MIFKYKGVDTAGRKVRSKIEAFSLSEAKVKLKAKGILYEKITQEQKSLFDGLQLSRRKKIAPKELSELSRELAAYLRSGISIVSALKAIQTHHESDKKMRLFLSTLSTLLDEGKNFYTALREQSVIELPLFYVESIKVSEDGGILDEVLLELARFLKEQEKIRKEIKSAFAYPSFMIVIALFMIAFMLTFVVPQITSIFQDMDQELPASTEFVIAAGAFFSNNFQFLLGGIFLDIALFIFLKKRFDAFAYFVDRFLLKLPLFGPIILKSELARFAYMASLLTRSGVPFVHTVNLSGNILNNRVIKKIFLDASQQVVEGKLLSKTLYESKDVIELSMIQTIALGEETSQLESVLHNISELYFEENRDKIAMLLTLLEPSLMLFVGGTIGFIVSAMLLPIFSMSIH